LVGFHVFFFLRWLVKAKNPRLPWQSRVLENPWLLLLRNEPRDAEQAGAALTNGQSAIDRRVHLSLFGERDVHFQRAQNSGFP
jgi:hypothetical protein